MTSLGRLHHRNRLLPTYGTGSRVRFNKFILKSNQYNHYISFLFLSVLFLSILSLLIPRQSASSGLDHKIGDKFTRIGNLHPPVLRNYYESILNAELHLVEIRHSTNKRIRNYTHYDIEAIFCQIDWLLHKKNPSVVPMFRMLVQKSPLCKQTHVKVHNFYDLVQATKKHDQNKLIIKSIAVTGFVFHESRCGSTLIANLLASFQPQQNRVYSEASPVITAARMNNVPLLQDVLYMLGRTNDPAERHVFYKIQSVGSNSIPTFREAFPKTPFIFLYRDPIQVLMSHLDISSSNKPSKSHILNRKNITSAVCLRSKHNPPSELQLLLEQKTNYKSTRGSIQGISNEKICAAHLATLCHTAFSQIRQSYGWGLLINYNSLPSAVTERIIPHFLQGRNKTMRPIDTQNWNWTLLKKMEETYSKAGTDEINNDWKEDTKQKEQSSWKELRKASHIFLEPLYQQMENYRLSLVY